MAVQGLRAGPGIRALLALLARGLAPVKVPRYWCAAAFAACALFAVGVSLFSDNGLHRRWGLVAACAYAVAAVAVLAWRRRGLDLALLVSVSGALITPLLWSFAGDDGRETLRATALAPESVFPAETLHERLAAAGFTTHPGCENGMNP